MSIYQLIFELFKPEHCNNYYLKRYLKLIEVYKERNLKRQKGFHSHHILPVSLSGGESPKNKVVVSPREHFILHWILYKTFPKSGMTFAFFAMCNGFSHYGFKITSRVYEQLSIAYSKRRSDTTKGVPKGPRSAEHQQKLNDAHRGRKHSDEHRKKNSDAHRGVPKGPLSTETRKKISEWQRGVPKPPLSTETRKKISDTLRGIPKPPRSVEHSQAISDGHARRRAAKLSSITTLDYFIQ